MADIMSSALGGQSPKGGPKSGAGSFAGMGARVADLDEGWRLVGKPRKEASHEGTKPAEPVGTLSIGCAAKTRRWWHESSPNCGPEARMPARKSRFGARPGNPRFSNVNRNVTSVPVAPMFIQIPSSERPTAGKSWATAPPDLGPHSGQPWSALEGASPHNWSKRMSSKTPVARCSCRGRLRGSAAEAPAARRDGTGRGQRLLRAPTARRRGIVDAGGVRGLAVRTPSGAARGSRPPGRKRRPGTTRERRQMRARRPSGERSCRDARTCPGSLCGRWG